MALTRPTGAAPMDGAEDPHDLLVERAGGSGASYAFPELGPGEVDRRTVALDAERGMSAALTVTG